MSSYTQLLSLIIILFLFTLKQVSGQRNFDYVFPINPGKPNFLAGTMGELRTGHFHGGIDIRTNSQIGFPVYATADGYISRIAIATGGYGHALYLQHDDGFNSVYAHLEKFEDRLQQYTVIRQYERNSYVIQDFPDKNRFRFKKGDLIAYSGNTGSSTGPHLHFEIRDKDQNFLNPLDFGYTEIDDQIPPTIKKVAFTSLDKDARINGMFGRFEFDVILVNKKYTTRRPIELQGRVGMEMYHYDFLNGTWSRNGIPELVYKIDGDTIYREIKNKISFNENREILVHVDHSTYLRSRERFSKFYLAPGNRLNIYTHAFNYYFNDDPHKLEVILRDNFDNISVLETTVNSRRIVNPEIPQFRDFEIRDNILHFKGDDTVAYLYFNRHIIPISPYNTIKGKTYFLWKLKKGMPDSIVFDQKSIVTNFYAQIPANAKTEFFNTDFEWSSQRNALFDTLYLRFEKTTDTFSNTERFAFMNRDHPIRNNITLTLKPRFEYGEKAAVFALNGSRMSYQTNERNEKGHFILKTRDLGTYTIAYDTVPPSITPVNWSRNNLKIHINDAESGIKNYRATLNGEFLLMRYETKQNLLMAVPKDQNNLPQGLFILEVEDRLGNISKIERQI